MLAGTDRLDRELTIGQMQGRFQMVVLPQVISMLQHQQAQGVLLRSGTPPSSTGEKS